MKQDESKLLLSYQLASSGMYKEAVDILESIDRGTINARFLTDYYSCSIMCYGELAFIQDKVSSAGYRKISDAYKDSLFHVVDHSTVCICQ